MDLPDVDKGSLLAAFSGAIAYLCMKGKMPVLVALTALVGGTLVAAFVAPGFIEWYNEVHPNAKMGDRTQGALTFLVGVSGIWLLNLLMSFFQEAQRRISSLYTGALSRLFPGVKFDEQQHQDDNGSSKP